MGPEYSSPRKSDHPTSPATPLRPRDEKVDADMTLERKRPRLSDDDEDNYSPSHSRCDNASAIGPSSPHDQSRHSSPHIELVSEDTVAGSDPHIVMFGGSTPEVDIFSRFPSITDTPTTATDAAAAFSDLLRNKESVAHEHWESFTDWLCDFVSHIAADQTTVPAAEFLSNIPFWNYIGSIFMHLSSCETLGQAFKLRHGPAQHLFSRMLSAYAIISVEILRVETHELERSLSRRDSLRPGEAVPTYQPLLLGCVNPLCDLLMGCNLWKVFADRLKFNCIDAFTEAAEAFLTESVDASVLLRLSRLAAISVDHLQQAAAVLQVSLRAMTASLGTFGKDSRTQRHSAGFVQNLERVFEVIDNELLPNSLKIQSRVVPDTFHLQLLEDHGALLFLLCDHAPVVCTSMFDEMQRSIDRTINDTTNTTAETAASRKNAEFVTRMTPQWRQHMSECVARGLKVLACRAFLTSPIATHQTTGIQRLNGVLVDTYIAYRDIDSMEHPVLQLIGFLLTSSKIVAHCVSKESHIDVVRHCSTTIEFLVRTGWYKYDDTDLIFELLQKNVQTEIFDATFSMLKSLVSSDCMQPHQISHLLLQLDNLPMHKIGEPALQLVATAAKSLKSLSVNAHEPEVHYHSASLIVRLLRGNSAVRPMSNTHAAHVTISAALTTVLDDSMNDQGLRTLVNECVGGLDGSEAAATGSIYALINILEHGGNRARMIVASTVPILAAVLVLEKYNAAQRRDANGRCDVYALAPRIILIVKLLALNQDELFETEEARLWDNVVGCKAANEKSRLYGTSHLLQLATKLGGIDGFLVRCITTYLPRLPAQLISRNILPLLDWATTSAAFSLRAQLAPVRVEQNTRLIVDSTTEELAHEFATRLIRPLFYGPALQMPHIVVPMHVAVTRQCLQSFVSRTLPQPRLVSLLARLLQESMKYEEACLSKPTMIGLATTDLVGSSSGESFEVTVVTSGHLNPAKKMTFVADQETTLSNLASGISQSTGMVAFSLIEGGRKLDIDEDSNLKLVDLGTNHLLASRINTAETIVADQAFSRPRCSVEAEILKDFDQIYNCLESNEELSRTIFELLTRLRSPVAFRTSVFHENVPTDTLFPTTNERKMMFTVHTLRILLDQQAQSGVADGQFISRAVRLLISVLLDESRTLDNDAICLIALAILHFINEHPVIDVSATFFEKPKAFLDRLLAILESLDSTLRAIPTDSPLIRGLDSVARTVYACLLEGVCISETLLRTLINDPVYIERHRALLVSSNPVVAHSMAQRIGFSCEQNTVPKDLKAWYWNVFSMVIDTTLLVPTAGHQVFFHAAPVLRSIRHLTEDETFARSLAKNLFGKLHSMEHNEVITIPEPDIKIIGLCEMLLECVSCLKALKQPLKFGDTAIQLYTKFLFQSAAGTNNVTDWHPLLMEHSRKLMYDLVLSLCEGMDIYDTLVDLTTSALEHADLISKDCYQGREWFLRAKCGYAGLANLSQTCYLNSILQQLFMNIDFRKFILELRIVQTPKQKLLYELQCLFAFLHGGHAIAYPPKDLAKELDIDVESQEDAHIFFTTLIGKLEDAMPDEDSKKQLQSFFGGRNRSQTRGKCGHVSESIDEYYNLSLVVKNKADLTQSLTEYVEGAPLEGGDRFKCLTCEAEGKHSYVDAMRRTGFEKVPDNLVFGLKRFRYETWDGGAKVNDRFNFPAHLDISKYKLSHLTNPEEPCDPDLYELVGVIVHQGTLQYGHYWSYAKDHHTYGQQPGAWYRLEDSHTSTSDLETMMRETCGGRNPRLATSEDRSDNAYILLYRRMPVAHADEQIVATEKRFSLLEIRTSTQVMLDQVNRETIRMVLLFDEVHVRFVRSLMMHAVSRSEADGDEASLIQHKILRMGHAYFKRILSQQKSAILLAEFSDAVRDVSLRSSAAAEHTVNFVFFDNVPETTFCHPKAAVRRHCNALATACLKHLRHNAPDTYGVGPDNSILGAAQRSIEDRLIHRTLDCHADVVLSTLRDFRPHWMSSLEFAAQVSNLGPEETLLVLNKGYLTWCFQSMLTLFNRNLQNRFPDFHRDCRAYMARWPWSPVIEFIYAILSQHVDLSDIADGPDAGPQAYMLDGLCRLGSEDRAALEYGSKAGCALVDSAFLLCHSKGLESYIDYPVGRLVSMLLQDNVQKGLSTWVRDTLVNLLQDVEDAWRFENLARATLCACLEAKVDRQTKLTLIRTVAQQAEPFDAVIPHIIAFMTSLLGHESKAVLQTLHFWILGALSSDTDDHTKAAIVWLVDHVIKPKVISTPSDKATLALDYDRLVAIKTLAKALIRSMRDIVARNDDSGAFEDQMKTLKKCAAYLIRMDKIFSHGMEDDDEDEEDWLSSDEDEEVVTDDLEEGKNPLSAFGGAVELPEAFVTETQNIADLLDDCYDCIKMANKWHSEWFDEPEDLNVQTPTRTHGIRLYNRVDQTIVVSDDEEVGES